MHVMLMGPVGSGKSVIAQHLIDEMLMRESPEFRRKLPPFFGVWRASRRYGRRMPWKHMVRRMVAPAPAGRVMAQERVYSTTPLSGHATEVVVTEGDRLYKVPHCGVVFVDELQLYLGSRTLYKMTQEALDFFTRHRHYDVHIVSTTQHISFVDKIVRILTDELWVVTMFSLPLVGLMFPESVRPPDMCRCGDCHGRRGRHARRDAKGDWFTPMRRRLRYGTVFVWTRWSSHVMTDIESTDALEVDRDVAGFRGFGWKLYSQELADRSRGTLAIRGEAQTPPGP